MARDLEREARGWRCCARELAAWAWERMVNRTDVWGLRTPEGESWTLPRKRDRGKVFLTERDLCDHYVGRYTYGVHASDRQFSLYGAVDYDNHDNSAETRSANIRDAALLCNALRRAGAAPLVEDSDGNGGLHVWLFFAERVSTYDLFHWLDGFRTSLGFTGELFPKQATITEYGNWIRLFGLHHRRSHWSRIALDGRWVAGENAARALLKHPLTPASVIPAAPPPRLATTTVEVELPEDCDALIRAYLAKVPHGGVGSDRSLKAFNIGRFLRTLRVGEEEAITFLQAWNAGNTPPLGKRKLLDAWQNSGRYSSTPVQLRAPLGTATKSSASRDPFARLPRSHATLDDLPRSVAHL